MRKPKTKPTLKPHEPNVEDTYDPSADRQALLEIIARIGPSKDPHFTAFETLIDDDARAELGVRTRGSSVFHEAVGWAVILDGSFTRYGGTLKEFYPRERFAYFLNRVAALDAAITYQEAHRGGLGATRTTADLHAEAARDVRQKLSFKLTRFASHRKAERQALADAKGRADDAVQLGASLQAMVALGRSWLDRADTTSKTLCAAAGITPELLDGAIAAAKALTGAAKDVTLAGRKRSADTPEVNLVEGTVLHEMDEAMTCVNEANAETKVIPRLVPGPATRHVVGPRPTPKSPTPEPEPAPPPTPAS